MLLRKLHRWLGLILCVFVLVMSVTGVLLVWKPEYQRMTVAGANDPLTNDLSRIAAALDEIVEQYPENSINLIQIHPNNLSVYKVFLTEKRYAFHNQLGERVQLWRSNERLEDWMLDLHHRFLLGNTIGLNIAGFSGILLGPLVFVGVFLWLRLRGASAFILWPKGGRPGQLLRSHRNLGVVSSAVILLVAFSGVILVYPVESAAVLLGGREKEAQAHVTEIANGSFKESTADKLSFALELFPGAKIRSLAPPSQYSDAVRIGVQQANGLNRLGNTRIAFRNHVHVRTANALEQRLSKRVFDFIFPLHTGLLPLWYRLLLTVFGLALVFVTSLGMLAYTKRRIKQHSSREQ